MHRRLLIAALALFPCAARAQGVGWQALVSVGGGATDNVLSRPEAVMPGEVGKEADAYADVAPQLVLSGIGSRSTYLASYQFAARAYADHSEGNTYSNQFTLGGYFLTSPNTETVASFSFLQGVSTTFRSILDNTQGGTPPMLQPAFATHFISGSANQALGWDVSRTVRLTENFFATGLKPTDDMPRQAESGQLGLRLGGERVFRIDGIGGEAGSDFVAFGRLSGPTGVTPAYQALIDHAILRWRHDISVGWSGELNAGVVHVAGLGGSSAGNLFGPQAGAALRYSQPDGTAAFEVRRDAALDPLFGAVFVQNRALVRVSMPIDKDRKFAVAGAWSYSYGQQIDPVTSDTTSTAHLVDVNGEVNWLVRSGVSLALRYLFFDQIGSAGDRNPIPDVTRQDIMLVLSASYPQGGGGVRVPRGLPTRVDRADAPLATPLRPAMPDGTEPPPQ
jgi:hypothetical protein